jgi:RHS repeat-associated protein
MVRTNYKYFYVLNLQGDVVKLINASGTTIANYAYSAYGEIISITDANGTAITSSTHVANINPLRYRGYYYDTETGFYYLQSRYYDPVIGRFINADSYASTGQGVLGTNMFAYCGNNPVNMSDPSGNIYYKNTDAYKWMQADIDAGGGIRDVSAAVDAALEKEAEAARMLAKAMELQAALSGEFFTPGTTALPYWTFYWTVKKNGPWDIKEEIPWKTTIGTRWPGKGTIIMYHGMLMTPEDLGNYTYGYLGAANGFSYETIIWGSEYAAGNPTSGEALEHELEDQKYVTLGYNAYP